MKKDSKEKATEPIRLFPSTHHRLKVQAADEGLTMAELVEDMSLKRKKSR